MAFAEGVSIDDPDGLYDAGATYLNFGRLDEALDYMQKALDKRPEFGDALNAIGVIYTKKRQYDTALQYYNRALALLPADAGVRMNIVLTYVLMGRRGDAEEEFKKVLDMDKTYGEIFDFLRLPIKEKK